MKKFNVLLFLVMAAVLMVGCSSSSSASGDKEVVTLWASGSDNVKSTYEILTDTFNNSEYGDEYELKVEFISSGAGAQSLMDRVLAASKAGEENTNFDIIELGDTDLAAYLSEGGDDFFEKIDHSKIANYENVLAETYAGQDVLIPYRGTTVVLAYNSDNVPNPPKTTEELYQWIKDNPQRFAYNTPGSGGAGSSFVVTSLYNSLPEEALTSDDPKWMDEWQTGFDLLTELHPYLYQSGGSTVYPNKNQGTLDLLANLSIDMTPAWVDMVVNQKNEGLLPESIELMQIDPALTGNLASLAIPKIGSNYEGAHAVFDFMVSVEAQQILLDEMAAFPVIDVSTIESDNAEMLSGFDVSTFRTSSLGTLSSEINERWDREIATLD